MKNVQLSDLPQLCDDAISAKDIKTIETLLSKIGSLSLCTKSDSLKAKLHYFAGNLCSSLSVIQGEVASGWRTGNFPEIKANAINHFRKCIRLTETKDDLLRNEATTNLGNELSSQGRGVEAIKYWTTDFKLKGDAPFVSAMMRSRELLTIGHWLNDSGHKDLYVYEAYQTTKALRENINKTSHPAANYYVTQDPQITNLFSVGDASLHVLDGWEKDHPDKSSTKEEAEYRSWCLRKRLFANPLNFLTDQPIANRDILQFPNHTVGIADGPFFAAAFSSAKREFCFARFLAFEGLNCLHPDYENKDLFLADTLDYVFLDGATEKLKTSWRVCFGVLDSLADLLNRYFQIGEKRPEFKSRWIRDHFSNISNPFIDALYWLACDLTESELIPSEKWKAPDAELSEIRKYRNSIEHGWLRVSLQSETIWNQESDFADQISPDDLKRLVMLTLQTVNAALFYVTLAVKFHETNRTQPEGPIAQGATTILHDPSAMRSLMTEE